MLPAPHSPHPPRRDQDWPWVSPKCSAAFLPWCRTNLWTHCHRVLPPPLQKFRSISWSRLGVCGAQCGAECTSVQVSALRRRPGRPLASLQLPPPGTGLSSHKSSAAGLGTWPFCVGSSFPSGRASAAHHTRAAVASAWAPRRALSLRSAHSQAKEARQACAGKGPSLAPSLPPRLLGSFIVPAQKEAELSSPKPHSSI